MNKKMLTMFVQNVKLDLFKIVNKQRREKKMRFRIKEIREEKNISQEKLSELSGVSRTIISGLETNNLSQTSTTSLMKIASALEVKVKDLFFEEEVQNSRLEVV